MKQIDYYDYIKNVKDMFTYFKKIVNKYRTNWVMLEYHVGFEYYFLYSGSETCQD